MIRAGPGTLTTAMAIMAFSMPRPNTLMKMIASRMLGKDWIISIRRLSTASTTPP